MLIVETTNSAYFIPAPRAAWNGTTLDKKKALFLLGRAWARENYETVESVQVIYLVTESWFVTRPKGTDMRKVGRAGEQPDRREALNVLELRVVDGHLKQSLHMAEIIRHGSLVDLVPRDPADDVESMLLPCFLAGIATADRSDENLAEAMRRFHEVGEL